jgi:hypothetical protein
MAGRHTKNSKKKKQPFPKSTSAANSVLFIGNNLILKLPRELRDQIYHDVLPEHIQISTMWQDSRTPTDFYDRHGYLLSCRQIRGEMLDLLYKTRTFQLPTPAHKSSISILENLEMLPTIRQRRYVQHLYWTPVIEDPFHGQQLVDFMPAWYFRNTCKEFGGIPEILRTFKNANNITLEEGAGWSESLYGAGKIETESCMGPSLKVGKDFAVAKQSSVPSLSERGVIRVVNQYYERYTERCWTSDIWVITRESRTDRRPEAHDWQLALSLAFHGLLNCDLP